MSRGEGKLCQGHTTGFSPSQWRPYDPKCRLCVALCGHLPPSQRDRPPLAPVRVWNNRRPPRARAR